MVGDKELLLGIRNDNMVSFDTLYRKYSRKIFKFAFSMLKSVEDSENIVQDVFLNLWLNRHRIEKDSSVKYYLFTITYNSSISVLRKKLSESKFVEYLNTLPDSENNAVNLEIEYNDLVNRLNAIVKSLPSRQKEVFQLHKIEGLKYQEISDKLNISVNTIENHMSSALRTIRKKLGAASFLPSLFFFLFVS